MSALLPDVDHASLRHISQGTLHGGLAANGALAWRGIPYAAPPVGELRWKAPRPAPRFEGELAALEHGSACVQDLSLAAPFKDDDGDGLAGSEDCLYLNVYAPAGTRSGDRLPVMYFIHGGGNVGGHNAAGTYDGSVLAQEQRVVVVTINYRLGLLGWFLHPALIEPDASPEDRSGNWGTLDTIFGLRWVRDNIAAFGGDRDNVTIFGESAGGVNVYALLLSPLAKGLFHRAIVQSGGLITDSLASACHYADHPAAPGSDNSARELCSKLLLRRGLAADAAAARVLQDGMTDRELAGLLRTATPGELIALANPERLRLYAAPRVLRDGHVLPKERWLDAIAAGRFHKVPLITGTNRDERRLYQFLDPRWRKTLRDAPGDYVLYAHYGSLAWKQYAVDDVARAMTRAGHGAVYAYRFDWDEQGAIEGLDISLAIGAGHAVELPFVFGTSSSLTPGLDGVTDESRHALSSSMMAYWGELAHTGAPGRGRGGRGPLWQPWSERAEEPCLMVFDTAADGGVRMTSERIDRDKLERELREETGFINASLHAQLYRGLFPGADEVTLQKLASRD
jgi:para-nitrobenzyl esterase